MAFVDMVNAYGEKVKIRVCDYCKTVCVPSGSRYCSGHCARNADELEVQAKRQPCQPKEAVADDAPAFVWSEAEYEAQKAVEKFSQME